MYLCLVAFLKKKKDIFNLVHMLSFGIICYTPIGNKYVNLIDHFGIYTKFASDFKCFYLVSVNLGS